MKLYYILPFKVYIKLEFKLQFLFQIFYLKKLTFFDVLLSLAFYLSMSTPLGHSTLTAKTVNDNFISQNITRSIRLNNPKYYQPKQQKISLELQYMRLQQQSKKQLLSYQQQVQQLKSQLNECQQMLQQAQNLQLQQKQEMNNLHRQNLRLYQQNEKSKKLITTLKSDNQSLQLQIERWKSDRKTYSNKLDSIYQLKKNMNIEIQKKNSLIQQQQSKIRQLQKKLTQYKLKVQQLSNIVNQKQRQNKQISGQVKNHLQGYLQTQHLAGKLQMQLNQMGEISLGMKQKISHLQKDKQALIQKIEELQGQRSDRVYGGDRDDDQYEIDNNPNYRPTTRHSKHPSNLKHPHQSPQLSQIITPSDQRLMLQIQTFMREFESLLQRKGQQKQHCMNQNERLVIAIQGLERNV